MKRNEIMEHSEYYLRKIIDNLKANRLKLLGLYINLVDTDSPDVADVSNLLNGLDCQINKNIIRINKWLEFLEFTTAALDKYYSGMRMNLYDLEYITDDAIDAINIQIGSLIIRLAFSNYNSFLNEITVLVSRSKDSGLTFKSTKKITISEECNDTNMTKEKLVATIIKWIDRNLPKIKRTLRAVESDADEILKESYDVDELIGEIME